LHVSIFEQPTDCKLEMHKNGKFDKRRLGN
jgi:hypothetical protein